MFIKIDENGNLLGHDYYSHDEYTTEVSESILVNLGGDYIGIYKYKYIDGALVELTEQEMAEHPLRIESLSLQARAQRDSKLAECDFVMMSDSPASEACKSAFVAYRQALRDVSEQENFPLEVVWPEKPEYIKAE